MFGKRSKKKTASKLRTVQPGHVANRQTEDEYYIQLATALSISEASSSYQKNEYSLEAEASLSEASFSEPELISIAIARSLAEENTEKETAEEAERGSKTSTEDTETKIPSTSFKLATVPLQTTNPFDSPASYTNPFDGNDRTSTNSFDSPAPYTEIFDGNDRTSEGSHEKLIPHRKTTDDNGGCIGSKQIFKGLPRNEINTEGVEPKEPRYFWEGGPPPSSVPSNDLGVIFAYPVESFDVKDLNTSLPNDSWISSPSAPPFCMGFERDFHRQSVPSAVFQKVI